jgi:hypothetical protein
LKTDKKLEFEVDVEGSADMMDCEEDGIVGDGMIERGVRCSQLS